MRGEIFDVFSPAYQLPLRIIFNHNIISDISFFNPLSQKLEKKVNNIDLLPITFPSGNNSIKNYINKNTILFHSTDLPTNLTNQPTLKWQLLGSESALPIGFTESPSFKYNRLELIGWLEKHWIGKLFLLHFNIVIGKKNFQIYKSKKIHLFLVVKMKN